MLVVMYGHVLSGAKIFLAKLWIHIHHFILLLLLATDAQQKWKQCSNAVHKAYEETILSM